MARELAPRWRRCQYSVVRKLSIHVRDHNHAKPRCTRPALNCNNGAAKSGERYNQQDQTQGAVLCVNQIAALSRLIKR